MASEADFFRELADDIRGIPSEFGLREYTVEVCVTTYGDEITGRGNKIHTTYPLTLAGGKPPKVRLPSQMEIALGMVGLGSTIIGPFTPQYSEQDGYTVGGVDRALLDGTRADKGDLVRILVTGPNFPTGCWHRIDKYQVDSALRVVLVCIQAEA